MTDEQLALVEGLNEPVLDRHAGLARLNKLAGSDLRRLADSYGITVSGKRGRNKGWAGQTVERYLGRSPNSDRRADFGTWELKVVPVRLDGKGVAKPKESMAIAMFTPDELETESFEESHLLAKLGRLVVVARTYENTDESESWVVGAVPFDLVPGSPAYEAVREDYEEARWVLCNEGEHALNGRIGRWVQPRCKGQGRRPTGGHCFYARTRFVSHILGLEQYLEG